MAKLSLTDIGYIPTAATPINSNSSAIEIAFENTLSRDGTAPNEMNAELDMNSNRIVNLPEATTATEPVRKAEFDEVAENIAELNDAAADAIQAAVEAAASAALAESYAESIGPDQFMPKAGGNFTGAVTILGNTPWDSGNFDPTLKANLASPALTGTPTAPTATLGTNTTQLATTAFVQAATGALDIIAGPASVTDNAIVRWDGTTGNTVQNAAVTIDDSGNITGAPALIRTGGVAIQGRNTSGSSAAGYVGELIGSDISFANRVSLTLTTAANVTSISLTPGTWLLYGNVNFNTATSQTRLEVGAGAASATLDGTLGYLYNALELAFVTGSPASLGFAPRLISLGSTTTYYLVARATGGSGTPQAYGTLQAVRIA